MAPDSAVSSTTVQVSSLGNTRGPQFLIVNQGGNLHSSGGAIQIVTATSKQEKEDAIKRREILARQNTGEMPIFLWIATEHRELHSSVSKVGKAVDRNFVADFDSTAREEVFSGPNKERLLSEVILQHFYRQGQLDISSTLAREAGVDAPIEQRQPFLEVNRILDAIRDRNIEPALDWARTNREALNLRGTTLKFSKSGVLQKSSLELKLHKLKFVELLRAGNKLAAITYARQNFPAFVDGQDQASHAAAAGARCVEH